MPSSRRSGTPTWADYRASIGDRSGVFAAVAEQWDPQRALYLGSYLDLSPSTAIGSVTYVDTDRRAARFFGDPALVEAGLDGRAPAGRATGVTFLQAGCTGDLPVRDAGFDLVLSLYAGPFWPGCARYLAPRGLFLANASHGEADLAALDPRVELVGAVVQDGVDVHVEREDLETYLVPRRAASMEAERIRRSGRGVPQTREAFAYVLQLR